MIKKYTPLILFLLFLSCISGYLLSQPSLVGKVGIHFIYREYRFLRVWWQGALVVFTVLLILMILQAVIFNKLQKPASTIIYIGIALLSLAGFYFTWQDFHHNTSHRWLRRNFHIGGYLFWLGCLLTTTFFLFQKKPDVK